MNEEQNATATAPETNAEETVSQEFDLASPFEIDHRPADDEAGDDTQQTDDNQVTDDQQTDEQQQTQETQETQTQEQQTPQAPTQPTAPVFQRPNTNVQIPEIKIPVDENGNVRIDALQQTLQQTVQTAVQLSQEAGRAEFADQIYTAREWEAVEGQYPDLVSDPTTRDMVDNLRMMDAIKGGKGDLLEAAKQVSDILAAREQKGKQSAQTSIRVVKQSALAPAGQKVNTEASNLASLKKKAYSGDENARLKYIAALHESGKL